MALYVVSVLMVIVPFSNVGGCLQSITIVYNNNVHRCIIFLYSNVQYSGAILCNILWSFVFHFGIVVKTINIPNFGRKKTHVNDVCTTALVHIRTYL